MSQGKTLSAVQSLWRSLGIHGPGSGNSFILRDVLFTSFSLLSLACWLVLYTWYSLFDHYATPHFAFDKIPGHFSSHILRQTTLLFFVISLTYFANYWLIRKASKISKIIKWSMILLVVSSGVINILLYPVGALDVFNYFIEMKLTYLYHQNPYLETFRQFAADPFAKYAFLLDARLGYPPGWLLLSGLPAALSGFDDLLRVLLIYKTFNFILIVLTGLAIYKYQDDEKDGWLAAYIFLANPLVLFESAANAHNDVMMTVFLIAAVLALKKNSSLAPPLLTLSVLTKFFSASIAPLFAAVMLMRKWSIDKVILSAFLALAVVLAVSVPFWANGEMIGGLVRGISAYKNMNSVSAFSLVREYLQQRQVSEGTLSYIWFAFAGLFVAYAMLVIWKLSCDGEFERAMSNTLLAFLLLLTVLFPWYLIPVIAILALRRDLMGSAYLFSASCLGLVFYPLSVWAWFNSGLSVFHIHLFQALFLTLPIVVLLALERLKPGARLDK